MDVLVALFLVKFDQINSVYLGMLRCFWKYMNRKDIFGSFDKEKQNIFLTASCAYAAGRAGLIMSILIDLWNS